MRIDPLPRLAILALALATQLLCSVLPSHAQGWQRVVQLNDLPGSGVGGGSGNTIYAGLANGSVYRSDDNGITWKPVSNGLVDSAGGGMAAKAFVVTPTGRVIRGGDNASWNNRIGSPIFYSDNQGALWNEAPLPFASSARNPAGIGVSDLVSHKGALYFSDVLSEGVWKSLDNGITWSSAGGQLPTAPFVGFVKTYYAIASAGEALLTVDATRGVFRSTDGGLTWSPSNQGIPGVANSPLLGGQTWNAVDVVGAPDGTAFAVVDDSVYRSRDGGATWEVVGDGIIMGPNPFVPTVIQPIARKVELMGDRVFVSSTDGNARFFEGANLGESWTELPRIVDNIGNGSVLAQSFAAHNGALYFTGSKGVHRLDLATTLRTNIAPVVTVTPPAPLVANIGGRLRASTRTRGTAPYTFEWRLNDSPIAGQTAGSLDWEATSTNQNGRLSVVVRNAAGAVTNQIGRASVAPVAPGYPDYSFRPQSSATPATAIAFGPDGSVFYAGSYPQLVGTYVAVRKALPDGSIDPTFSVTAASRGADSIVPLSDGSVFVGPTAVLNNNQYHPHLLPSGVVDASLRWPAETGGLIRRVYRLPDGKFLAAGGGAGGIYRLNPDGSFDPSFQGPTSIGTVARQFINDFVVLPDGRILIVGNFNAIDNVSTGCIARLQPNGALDRSWTPALPPNGSSINTVAITPDGKILIGGAFVTVGGQAHRNLARLNPDGTLDPSLADIIPNTNPAGVVNAFAVQPDGKVWVGGAFSGVSGRRYLFRLNGNGTVDTSIPDLGLSTTFDQQNPAPVVALKLTADGRLWIGSSAIRSGDFSAGQLFRIFTDLNGPTLAYAGLDSTPDLGSSVTLRGSVTGTFTGLQWRLNGVAIPGATSANLTLNNVSSANSGRYDLVVTSANGTFTSTPATVRVRGPVVLDEEPAPVVGILSNSVSLAVSAFGKLPLSYQWSKDGTLLPNATNRTLSLTNLQLTATGDYTVRVNGGDGSSATSEPAFLTVIPRPGSTNSTFRLGLFRTTTLTLIKDIEFLPDGRALVLGNFSTTTSGGPNAFLTRLNANGSVDSSFRFDASGIFEATAFERLPNGKILALLRSNTPHVRRLNEDGSLDTSFPIVTVNGATDLKATANGGILVLSQAGIERLLPDGSSDDAFNQRAKLNSGATSASEDPSGRIYVTGTFTTVGGQPRPQLARLLADGTLDATFRPTNSFSSQWFVTALPDGAFVGDLQGFYRLDESGQRNSGYGWTSRLLQWDLTPAGTLVGVLPTTSGDGVIRQPDGSPASPTSTMKVPVSFSGYSFLRVAPDGAIWLGLGGSGSGVDPGTMLFRLNGTVTSLALLTSPQSQTVNAGANVTLNASAVGTSKLLYQWRLNGTPIPGATNATLLLNNIQPSANGDYSVVVSNRSGSVTSNPASVVALSIPEILQTSGGGELPLGGTLILSVQARGVSPLTYQWRRNGTPLPGATSDSYTNSALALTDSGQYDVVVSNSLGARPSNPILVQVVVRPGSVISGFPDLGLGQGVKELNLLPNGDFLADGVARNRRGDRIFALPLTTTDLREKLVVDAALGRIYMADGPKFAFDLLGNHLTSVPRPNINMRLARLEASGSLLISDNGFTPTLRRVDTNGLILTNLTPAINPIIDVAPLPDGKLMVLSYAQRTLQGALVYDTQVARLLPNGTLDNSFTRVTNTLALAKRAERVSVDRQGRTLVFGAFESFNGQSRSRIARLLPDGSLDASFNPPVINGAILEIAQQLNGKLVIVGEFTQVGGLSRSLIARLNPDGSHDTRFNPGTGLTLTSGQNVAFDVKILPAGEILVAGTFQAADGLSRKGLALLSGDPLDIYFTEEPADIETIPGSSVVLTSTATGSSTVSFQWFKNGQPLNGQTSASLRLNSISTTSAGVYHVVIRNDAGELTSRSATLVVLSAPVIVSSPQSVVINYGAPTTFRVEATGLRLSYQWLFNNLPISGETNTSLVIAAAKEPAVGSYSVAVQNPAGSTVSTPALLRLRPRPIPTTPIPTTGLIGEVLFEGNFAERSNRFPTIIKGTPTFVEGVGGGQAARLRSSTNWLQLGTANAALAGTTYSASFWIWPEDTGSINVYSLTMFLGTIRREHYLYLGGNDTATQGQRVVLGTLGLTAVHSSDDRAYVPNLVGKWTHVAVTYRGSGANLAANYEVYINGTAIPLVNSTNLITGTANGNGLGVRGPAATFRLDDFRVYDHALTLDEVDRLGALSPTGTAALKPSISRQPAGGSAPAGGSFTLSVTATGENLFYEWFRGSTLLPSADGPNLVLRDLSSTDAGEYRVVISNPAGSTNSTTATLSIGTSTDPFSAWAAEAGLVGDRALPSADADSDGIVNLAEFAFGSSPTNPDQKPRFTLGTITVGGIQYPTAAFTRRSQLGSSRLDPSTASNVLFTDPTPAETVSITPRAGDLEDVIIRSSKPLNATPHHFFRFTVSTPPR